MSIRSFSLFLFLIILFSAQAHAVVVDKIAAVVNNEVILSSDIEKFEKSFSLRKELDPLFGFSQDLLASNFNRKKVLDFLVQEKLITQTFKVTDEEIEQEIQNIQNTNSLSRDDLISFLKTKGFVFSDYFDLLRIGLAKRALLDREIRTRVNINEDDIKNYYYNNFLKNSKAPIEYNVQMITISNSNYKSQKAAQDLAEDSLKAIKQGEVFAEVAKRVSDDSYAAAGGDLGYISSENLSEVLKNAVKKLKPGAISDLIKTPTGTIILKLVDFRSPDFKEVKEKRNQIQEILAKEEYRRQLELWAERTLNGAYVHIN